MVQAELVPARVAIPGAASRLWRRVRPKSFLGGLVFVMWALLAALLVLPLGQTVIEVLTGTSSTGQNAFEQVLALPGVGRTILNTVVVVALSTVLATSIAVVFAWLNERTNARLGFVAEILPLTTLLVPALAGTVGWVFLTSPSSGMLNIALRDLLGAFGISLADGPLDIFTMPGLVFLYALNIVPYVYLPVSAAMSQLDSSLEEASRVCGYGPLRSFFKVTLPAVRPAVVSGAFLGSIIGFATFSIAVIVGTGAGIDIVSVRVYTLLTAQYPPRTDPAVLLSLMLLAAILLLSLLQRRILRSGGFATIGGRGIRPSKVDLGRMVLPARVLMIGFVVCSSAVPLIGLVYIALRGFWSPELTLSGLSLENFRKVLFDGSALGEALTNSILLAVVGMLITLAVAMVFALYTGRARGQLGRWVDALAKAPGGLSHLLLAIAFLTVLAAPPFRMSGTITILLLAYVVFFLPQAYVSASAAHAQLGSELGEASAMCGAGPVRTLRAVTLPLMAPGMVGGAILVFVLIMSEVTGSALLSGSSTPVVGFLMLDLWSNGTFPEIAALGAIMAVITATFTIVALYFGRRRTRALGAASAPIARAN
ncbi:ABC transporter permease [Actinophytocola sp.]|uniref:ABC transporter permease n=1 Tax=Actinophytocola sp. TaxID=1872138 RepID=UPI003D6B6FC5